MKILITGVCGFVGSYLAMTLREAQQDWQLFGVDNFIRPGSESNREALRQGGVKLFYGDVRCSSDVDALPKVDWVIDAAANPSVLAGVDGKSSSRQVVEHNLSGTINLLEYCRRHGAGFLLLSTSRVYSIPPLASLPVKTSEDGNRFVLSAKEAAALFQAGLSEHGVSETFSTQPPVSLYGATKLASEMLALEYSETFGFPVWINRCGVLAGAGQFGRPDQGILAYWINSYLRRQPLKFIGFGGTGHQVRDAFHPRDLTPLLIQQMNAVSSSEKQRPRIVNLGGGLSNTFSLAELHAWCAQRFGFAHPVAADPQPRVFDIPWMVMDDALAEHVWGWQPRTSLEEILAEIASHAEDSPNWLELSAPL